MTEPVTVITEGEARRRIAAREMALPLSASWDAIRAEQERRGRPVVAGFAPRPEDADALEKHTQAEVVKLFRAFGGVVYSLSQARATKQTPGIPDLFVLFPARRLATWWETKRPTGGRLSPAQAEFRDYCATCGIPWASGARTDAEAWLIAHGVCVREADGTLTPLKSEAA